MLLRPAFYVDSKDPNSGLHIYGAGAFLAEPFPQPVFTMCNASSLVYTRVCVVLCLSSYMYILTMTTLLPGVNGLPCGMALLKSYSRKEPLHL